MPLATSLDQLTQDLSAAEQQQLERGEVVLTGNDGSYTALALVQAPSQTVWEVLTAYEEFPNFLPSVVHSRVLERRDNRALVERKDRRKVGWLPIKVKIVTENIEVDQERIDYRMVDGTLDSMQGQWRLIALEQSDRPATLLMQTIDAKASMGPLQPYFYDVFEEGIVEMIGDLRTEIERRV